MPGGDGTGPRGNGPGTGRGRGGCVGGSNSGRTGSRNSFSVNWESDDKEETKQKSDNTDLKAEVNKEECISCGVCLSSCPNEAISMNDKAEIDKNKCNGCGECVSVCPVDAIKLK
ncbi:MAG: DUF362 domain-containing protein [Elusimicrobiota bacterium]